jgi:hypothetical protein
VAGERLFKISMKQVTNRMAQAAARTKAYPKKFKKTK